MTGLLDALVDDAGLFPPEELSMAAALDRHAADRFAASPVLSHRFVVAVERLPEALAALGDRALTLVVVCDPPDVADVVAYLAADPRTHLDAVDVRVPGADPALLAEAAGAVRGPGVRLWAETGWDVAAEAAATALAGVPGAGRKLRCGGVRAELFPSSEQVAAALVACAAAGVPVKATAGLHGAVRHVDPATGFDHHGFADLLLAAAHAAAGADVATVAAALDERDGAALAAALLALPPERVTAARALFTGYGSCSTSEPLEEAAALGLL